jgi:hypothetical protein
MPGFSQPGARSTPAAPEVRLGALAAGGLAPAIMAIVERGVSRRPVRIDGGLGLMRSFLGVVRL